MPCDSTVPVIQISTLFEILIAIRNTGGTAGSPIDEAVHAFLDGDIDQAKGLTSAALGIFAGEFADFADFFRDFGRELVKAVKVIGWMCESDQVIDSLRGWNETSTLSQMSTDLVDEFDPKVNFTLFSYSVVLN